MFNAITTSLFQQPPQKLQLATGYIRKIFKSVLYPLYIILLLLTQQFLSHTSSCHTHFYYRKSSFDPRNCIIMAYVFDKWYNLLEFVIIDIYICWPIIIAGNQEDHVHSAIIYIYVGRSKLLKFKCWCIPVKRLILRMFIVYPTSRCRHWSRKSKGGWLDIAVAAACESHLAIGESGGGGAYS